MSNKKVRHILSVSGGKDSAALSIYMRDRVPEMEYVFCDTEKELPETYEYLDRLEAFLGKPIVRLKDASGFDHWHRVFGGYLPSARMRWCTKYLKLFPFERYVDDSTVISYVGIRADEDRIGYVSGKPNIRATYPFRENGLCYSDVLDILNNAGLGLPTYYAWRSRSGCFFCFFQQKIEWVGLLENHPDLYWAASRYEKTDSETGKRFTWCDRESLQELSRPDRILEIKKEHERRNETRKVHDSRLLRVFEDDLGPQSCLICTL